VAAAAIAIADADGLAALSMRRVAERLGVKAMSLYTYVPGKAELIDLMFDSVLAEVAADDGGGDWRTRLERVPSGIRTTETGRLEEDRRAEIVRDYWVRAQDGRWYPVPLDRYRSAEVGGSMEVCR